MADNGNSNGRKTIGVNTGISVAVVIAIIGLVIGATVRPTTEIAIAGENARTAREISERNRQEIARIAERLGDISAALARIEGAMGVRP